MSERVEWLLAGLAASRRLTDTEAELLHLANLGAALFL
jgi:hypothetical protein